MSNWFSTQRQNWIAEILKIYGFINRVHLMRKFGISGAQAVIDFNTFNQENPGIMIYDNRQKHYVATEIPKKISQKLK